MQNNIKYLVGIIIGLLPFFVFAHEATALPSPGLTPESRFYFLDRAGEAIRQFFTFNPDAKAHLEIIFAKERIAEIKIILETRGVNAPGLTVAESRLSGHLASVSSIVIREKNKGKDVSALAKELNNEVGSSNSSLNQVFKEQKQVLEEKIDDLKDKIREAKKAGNAAEAENLSKQLAGLKAEKELLENKEDEKEEVFEKEKERVEEEMEDKDEAESAIKEAEEEKDEMIKEALDEGIAIPGESFTKFGQLLSQAKELFSAGNYQGAEQLAKQAKKSLDKIEDAVEELEDIKEEEEDLREEKEDKAEEAREKQEEKSKKDAEKEAERLEDERERAEEEIRRAEERLRNIGNED